MALLTLNFDKNFIYVIIFWALEITFRILSTYKREYFEMIQDNIQNEYMFVILSNASDLL